MSAKERKMNQEEYKKLKSNKLTIFAPVGISQNFAFTNVVAKFA